MGFDQILTLFPLSEVCTVNQWIFHAGPVTLCGSRCGRRTLKISPSAHEKIVETIIGGGCPVRSSSESAGRGEMQRRRGVIFECMNGRL